MKFRESVNAVKAIPSQVATNTAIAISAFIVACIALAMVLIGGVRHAN